MKVNVTCGCEISIEEIDGKCTVIATQDGEVVEEFTIDCEGSSDEEFDEDDFDNDAPEGEEFDDIDVEEEAGEEAGGEEFEGEEEEILEESVKTFSKFFDKKPKRTRRTSKRRK
tara:strand:+ start:16749 stop:17090 length:342 start_codon:yes stop_codon:yes gene_type:complete